jgi:hypothetical protein
MEYLPNEYGGYGGLSVKIVKAEGLEVHEMNEKVEKSKSKASKAVIDVETTRWVKPFVDIVLVHEGGRRDAVKRKTMTVKKVLEGESASFEQTKLFELSRTACDKKNLALEVWHKTGILKDDIFLGLVEVSVKDALAAGTELTGQLSAIEVPEKPKWNEGLEDTSLKRAKTIAAKVKKARKRANTGVAKAKTVIFGVNFSQVKKDWESILKHEARPWDNKLLAKLQCMYDQDDVKKLVAAEEKRQTVEKAKKAAQGVAILAAAGAGTMIGMGSSSAMIAKFAIAKIRKYAESRIGKQDKEHNDYAPFFKKETDYYHVSKETWMKKVHDPLDHGTEMYSCKRSLQTSYQAKTENARQSHHRLVKIKEDLFLKKQKPEKKPAQNIVVQGEVVNVRNFDNRDHLHEKWVSNEYFAVHGVEQGMFDALPKYALTIEGTDPRTPEINAAVGEKATAVTELALDPPTSFCTNCHCEPGPTKGMFCDHCGTNERGNTFQTTPSPTPAATTPAAAPEEEFDSDPFFF